MTKAMLLAAATICAAPNLPAHADPAPARTVHVALASFDLETPEGRAALKVQLDRAVDAVCGKLSDPQESRKHEAYSCRRDTVPSVEAQLASLANPRLHKVTVEHVSGGR